MFAIGVHILTHSTQTWFRTCWFYMGNDSHWTRCRSCEGNILPVVRRPVHPEETAIGQAGRRKNGDSRRDEDRTADLQYLLLVSGLPRYVTMV